MGTPTAGQGKKCALQARRRHARAQIVRLRATCLPSAARPAAVSLEDEALQRSERWGGALWCEARLHCLPVPVLQPLVLRDSAGSQLPRTKHDAKRQLAR
eukprot:6191167-Pleurochrysis_carterae.AAC.1